MLDTNCFNGESISVVQASNHPSSTFSAQEEQTLRELRHTLHGKAEASHQEEQTAKVLTEFLNQHKPDQILTDIAGHGILAIFEGQEKGPSILIRSDMDGLPIEEKDEKGETRATSHRCGHDGHMAMVSGVALKLAQFRPPKGKVALLFQPAEEVGEGAAKVLEDQAFSQAIHPDFAFALHNLPGLPLGTVVLRDGVFASASEGMQIFFKGKTSHAAEPHQGVSPALALAQVIEALSSAPQFHTGLADAAQATLIHARFGEADAFGTSPGEGWIQATLRAHDDDVMNTLKRECTSLAERLGKAHRLNTEITWTQGFPVTNNVSKLNGFIEASAKKLKLPIQRPALPYAWSEDFGHFTHTYPGALFGLGSGKTQPALHNPDYEFPDDLIVSGSSLFLEIITQALESSTDV